MDEVSIVFDQIYHNNIAYRANEWSSVVLLILQYFQSGISWLRLKLLDKIFMRVSVYTFHVFKAWKAFWKSLASGMQCQYIMNVHMDLQVNYVNEVEWSRLRFTIKC